MVKLGEIKPVVASGSMGIDYDGLVFQSVGSNEGDVDGDTRFHYRQSGDVVSGTYTGGGVRAGMLIALVGPTGELDMRYQHVSRDGRLMTGVCRSRPERLEDGRLRLHESWQWTCGDHSTGTSVVEQVLGAPATQ